MKHNILPPHDYHFRSKEWPSDAILLPKSTKAPFLSRILHLSPLQGHRSPFLKVRTMRNVPLSLSIPYRAGVRAKESIWRSAVPGSCRNAPGERGERAEHSPQPSPSSSEAPGKSGEKLEKHQSGRDVQAKETARDSVYFSASAASKKSV